MIQTLDPIQHILDKLSQEDCEDLIDFFSKLHMQVNANAEWDNNKVDAIIAVDDFVTKLGTVDVFDKIYPKETEPTQQAKDIEATFGYKPVTRPVFKKE